MNGSATVIVPTWNGAGRIGDTLSAFDGDSQVIVVDNGSTDGTRQLVERSFPHVEVLALSRNEGFSRAVNRAAAVAEGDVLILVNDDCVCRPRFVDHLVGGLDPGDSVVMAAGVMVEASDDTVIDSAGIELDRTLLVFDYLNGFPLEHAKSAPPPIGPSGAAAAFSRDAFLAAGGFDERLFAYWEDIDLALRLRLEGARCALVPDAVAVHRHSSTLGSGSSRKNYLTGFGRGYVLRRWSVLAPRRMPAVLAAESAICAAQIVFDRNAAGIGGRIAGWRAAGTVRPYPYPSFDANDVGLLRQMARRRARRARLTSHARYEARG